MWFSKQLSQEDEQNDRKATCDGEKPSKGASVGRIENLREVDTEGEEKCESLNRWPYPLRDSDPILLDEMM